MFFLILANKQTMKVGVNIIMDGRGRAACTQCRTAAAMVAGSGISGEQRNTGLLVQNPGTVESMGFLPHRNGI